MLVWITTIVIALIVVRFAIKLDYTKNDGMVMTDLEEVYVLVICGIVLLVPILNLLLAFALLGYVLSDMLSSCDIEGFIKKVLFIKDKDTQINTEGASHDRKRKAKKLFR